MILLGELLKTIDFSMYGKVICKIKNFENVVYANGKMLMNLEHSQNPVISHKVVEHDFLDDDLIIEVGMSQREKERLGHD